MSLLCLFTPIVPKQVKLRGARISQKLEIPVQSFAVNGPCLMRSSTLQHIKKFFGGHDFDIDIVLNVLQMFVTGNDDLAVKRHSALNKFIVIGIGLDNCKAGR